MTERPTTLYGRIRWTLRPRTRYLAWRGKLPPVSVLDQPGWPADFRKWVARRAGRRTGGFPEQWRARDDLPITEPSRVAVVVHAYYPELVDELFDRIRRLPVPYDLLVTNATGAPLAVPDGMGRLRNARVLDVDNHGRDILPLVSLVNGGHLDPYQVVLKLHTKRSQWRADHELGGDGDTWRASLLDALVGTTEDIEAVLSSFATRPDLGVVTADGSVLGPEEWGDNQDHVANLLRRLELSLDEPSLRFAAGSMYWVRGFVLQGLRALNLTAHDFEEEGGQVNATTAHAIERLLGVVAREAGVAVVERSSLPPPVDADAYARYGDEPQVARARVVPFYLPQFHPIPENDRWWGKGFTEWTNVTAARPVYEGHYQPRLPTDLGFYDLRLDEVRRAQCDLASAHGVEGFMYYHYWFAGRQLLERPIESLSKSDLAQPFCIMWANENWTRRWDGRDTDVLIGQDYDRVPAEQFIDDVMPLLTDERYLTIGGAKVLAVYRPGQITGLRDVVAAWRARAREAGAGELYLVTVDVGSEFHGMVGSLEENGFDGSLAFPPHNHLYKWLPHQGVGITPGFEGNLLSYAALVEDAESRVRAGITPTHFPGVMVTFDNTPRRPTAPDIWYGSNPYTFRRWLATAVEALRDRPPDQRVVFVNAWNEWAEGAVLEPSDRFGLTYLQAVRDVVLA